MRDILVVNRNRYVTLIDAKTGQSANRLKDRQVLACLRQIMPRDFFSAAAEKYLDENDG